MLLESARILEEKGLPFRIIELSGKAISCEDVVKFAAGKVRPEEICKTIVVKSGQGNAYAFFLKGNRKVDFLKAKEVIGQKVSIVGYGDLLALTGTEPGAICPLLLKFPVFADKSVFETEKINFGSGNHLFGIEMNSTDLEKAISFRVVDVAQ